MRRAVISGLGIAVLAALSACGSGDQDSSPAPEPTGTASEAATPRGTERPQLLLDFDSVAAPGQPVDAVANEGTTSLMVSAVTSGSARVVAADDPEGGRAVRFPAFTDSATPAAAALVAVDDLHSLDPRDRDFSFGASFSLDRRSSGSALDDGNNLIQRGGFTGSQFKIQVDRRVPSCRVAGRKGEIFVEAEDPVVPGRWYTVTCARSASQVDLTVTPRGRGEEARTWSSSGPIGTVYLDLVPIAIGAKVGPNGEAVASADQFNGAVDDVFVHVE